MNEIQIHSKLADKYLYVRKHKCFSMYYKYWHQEISKFFEGKAASILECGCGSGELVAYLKEKDFFAVGLDLSIDMLSGSDESVQQNLLAANTEQLPFQDCFFDVVICKGSLHHLDNPEKGLREIRRVLKNGGQVIISEPCRDNYLWRKAAQLYTKIKSSFHDSHRVFTSKELDYLFEKTEFVLRGKESFGFFGFLCLAMPQQISIFKNLPFSSNLATALIYIDNFLSKIKIFDFISWHKIILLEK